MDRLGLNCNIFIERRASAGVHTIHEWVAIEQWPLRIAHDSMTHSAPHRVLEPKLDGWKEIAVHFGRTVRTIQRWERDQGLPVRRLVHASGASVYAIASELEEWRRQHSPQASTADKGTGSDTHNANALFRMSRHHWALRTKEGFRKSIALARTALQRDPTHAPSYAMLALVYVTRSTYGQGPPATEVNLAREAATTALQLDSTLVEAHQALGHIRLFYEWDWAGARDAFETALRLNPSDPTTHQWFSLWHLVQHRDEEACALAARAEELDGGQLLIYPTHTAWMLQLSGRLDEALARTRAIIRRDEHFWRGYFNLALTLVALGRNTEALRAIEVASALSDNTALSGILVHALARSGQTARAQETLRQVLDSGDYISPYWTAFGAMGLNLTDYALERLAEGVAMREWFVLFLNHARVFDDLRSALPFKTLCQTIGLP
jgi:tetratricopeptide (TPR) repeat protein